MRDANGTRNAWDPLLFRTSLLSKSVLAKECNKETRADAARFYHFLGLNISFLPAVFLPLKVMSILVFP